MLVRSGLVLGGAAAGAISSRSAPARADSWWDGGDATAGAEVPAVAVRPGELRYFALTRGCDQRFSGTPEYVAVVTTAGSVSPPSARR